MTNVLQLADAAVELLGRLQLEGGDDAEAEQGRSPTPRSHVNDFPEVPSEDVDALGGGDGDAGREQARAYDAIDDATDILQQLIDDPQLISALDDDHQERLRVAVQHITKSIAKGELDLDIPLSVKAIIKDDSGRTLVLRDARSSGVGCECGCHDE